MTSDQIKQQLIAIRLQVTELGYKHLTDINECEINVVVEQLEPFAQIEKVFDKVIYNYGK